MPFPWQTFWEWLDVGLQLIPFMDLASDVYLLIVVWPSTRIIAPSSIESCEEQVLWSLALAFTVIGTLVDLMPEALLLTELIQHPNVFTTQHGAWRILRLFCSDGKPIIAFAATDDIAHEGLWSRFPVTAPLEKIRFSLRRRLAAIAAGLHARDRLECDEGYRQQPEWTYAGLLGILLGGEILTAVGASVFLHIKFSRAALVSLMASILSLLLSTRSTMSVVREQSLHAPRPRASTTSSGVASCGAAIGSTICFLIPGPLTLIRFLLMVPVWPMAVVYAEASSFWPFSLLDDNWGRWLWRLRSNDAMWVNPLAWLRIAAPTFGRLAFGDTSTASLMTWAIAPHLAWALVAAAWMALSGSFYVIRWYFGCTRTRGSSVPASHFADQYSTFHSLTRRLQGVLGLGFTMVVAGGRRFAFFFVVLMAVVLYLAAVDDVGYARSCAAEQEWIFVFAVTAWWWVMLVGHAARRRNFFMNVVVTSPFPS